MACPFKPLFNLTKIAQMQNQFYRYLVRKYALDASSERTKLLGRFKGSGMLMEVDPITQDILHLQKVNIPTDL